MRTICLMAMLVAAALALPAKPTSLKDIIRVGPEGSRNSLLESLVLEQLEEVREIMLQGSGDIPVLDPLEVEYLSLDDNTIPFPGAHVEVQGVTVSNLATFVIDNLSITMTSLLLQRYRVEIDGRVPVLETDVEHYDLSVSALGANLFGTGDAKLQVINPRLKVEVVVRVRFSGLSVYLDLLETHAQFSLEQFKPQITGLFHHEGASVFANDFLEDIVPVLLDVFEPEITEFLSTSLHELGREILADLDLGSLISP